MRFLAGFRGALNGSLAAGVTVALAAVMLTPLSETTAEAAEVTQTTTVISPTIAKRATAVSQLVATRQAMGLNTRLSTLSSPTGTKSAEKVKTSSGRNIKLKVSASKKSVKYGDTVTVTGKLSKLRKGKKHKVLLQQWVNKKWKTIRTTYTSSKTVKWKNIKTLTRDTYYQIVSTKQGGYRYKESANAKVKVLWCPSTSKPKYTLDAWFWQPAKSKKYKTSTLTTKFVEAICNAEKKSTIRIAQYYIYKGGIEVQFILRALDYVRKYRKIKVKFIVEKTTFRTDFKDPEPEIRQTYSQRRSSKKTIRKIGSVTMCDHSCKDTRSLSNGGNGNMHQKYMIISNMRWKKGKDPLVINGTANWSGAQLKQNWNNATVFYNDKEMYKNFYYNWEGMKACSKGSSSCAKWNKGKSAKYKLYNYEKNGKTTGRWVNKTTEHKGKKGWGTTVIFNPVATYKYDDYIRNGFKTIRCNSKHNTVDIALGKVTNARYDEFIDGLTSLMKNGCKVKVVLHKVSDGYTPTKAAKALKAFATKYKTSSGSTGKITFKCAANMHNKNYIFDTYSKTSNGNRLYTGVWAGSPSLSAGLLINDEAYNSMILQEASNTTAMKEIKRVTKLYKSDFNKLWNRAKGCKW